MSGFEHLYMYLKYNFFTPPNISFIAFGLKHILHSNPMIFPLPANPKNVNPFTKFMYAVVKMNTKSCMISDNNLLLSPIIMHCSD